MYVGPKSNHQAMLGAEALTIVEISTITALVTEDDNHNPAGIVHLHDILRAGVV